SRHSARTNPDGHETRYRWRSLRASRSRHYWRTFGFGSRNGLSRSCGVPLVPRKRRSTQGGIAGVSPRIAVCAVILVLFQSIAGWAQTPRPSPPPVRLSVTDAEALALKNNPQVTVANLTALASQQVVRE